MSNLLGSAAWSSDPGYPRYVRIGNAGAPVEGCFLLLGESHVRGNLHIRPPLQHLISIAPTRSGKGVSLIIPNLLTYRGSVLVVDPKGENAWVTAAFRRQAFGQKTVIVDPWGEVNRRYGAMVGAAEPIARFNPLSILDPGSDEYVDNLAYLADCDHHQPGQPRSALGGQRPRAGRGPHGLRGRESALPPLCFARPRARPAHAAGAGIAGRDPGRAGFGRGQHRTNEARPLRCRHARDQFRDVDRANADGVSRQRSSLAQHGRVGFQFRRIVPGQHLDLSGAAARQIGKLCALAPAYGLDRDPRGLARGIAEPTADAFCAGRVRHYREADRGRPGLRPHGRPGHDLLGLRAGSQSIEARLSRALGNVHRQLAGGDVLRGHG